MTLRTGNRSFTFIEIMVTTAILSLGIVLVYKSFFNLLDAFSYCSDYLSIQPITDEIVWQAEDDFKRYGKFINAKTWGFFLSRNRRFTWDLGADLIDGSRNFNLYRINLRFSWKEGPEEVNITRFTYALQARQQ
jgi:hypothetical protein